MPISIPVRPRPVSLTRIKLLHTIVWAFIAGSIVALPFAAFAGHFRWAAVITAIVIGECIVLGINRGRCPLTDWAEQCSSHDAASEQRADNFDIYLPNWLARHNKVLFGALFIVNEAIVLWCWLRRP